MRERKDLQLKDPNEDTFGLDHLLPHRINLEFGRNPATELMNAASDYAFTKLKKYYDLSDYSVFTLPPLSSTRT